MVIFKLAGYIKMYDPNGCTISAKIAKNQPLFSVVAKQMLKIEVHCLDVRPALFVPQCSMNISFDFVFTFSMFSKQKHRVYMQSLCSLLFASVPSGSPRLQISKANTFDSYSYGYGVV